jgi:hypothetical protein
MSNQRLLFPESIPGELTKRYSKRHKVWLNDQEEWPLSIDLGGPTEEEVLRDRELVQKWILSWQSWSGGGALSWRERRWRQLGTQSVPHKLIFDSPQMVADLVGEGQRWRRAEERHRIITSRWPALRNCLSKYFELLADYDDNDFHRLQLLVDWFSSNTQSRLYPRQIPVAGIDSKWFEKRSSVICDLVANLNPDTTTGDDIFQKLGLRRPPDLCRIRLLDYMMCTDTGGLADITAPAAEIMGLRIAPRNVFIVENLQTFLAFEELKGAAVILGMGYRAKQMCLFPWLAEARCFYWGDIDTHGYAILSQARAVLPALTSRLMDEETLIENRELWSNEDAPTMQILPNLDASESRVYEGLRHKLWGTSVRLEQERLSWAKAWNAVTAGVEVQS